MKRFVFSMLAMAVGAVSGFGATATLNCTPQNGVNTSIVVQSLFFTQGSGSGSFLCSDASLGPLTLSSVSISILTDYTKGNGAATGSPVNSAGFTFSTSSTWAAASAGGTATTMNLASGVTVFTIGNLSSTASSFTNTTSGGLGGTQFVQPTTDAENALTGSNTINVTGFVDAGGFTNGASDASITVTYSYTPGTPEPISLVLFGSGLVGLSILGRRKFARK